MKKIKIWRIIWIAGIYIVLLSILYLVILYKVRWEDRDLNTYLYFYNCSGSLCTSTQKQEKKYGYIACENRICPYITDRNEDILILSNGENCFLYNFTDDKVLTDKYLDCKRTIDNNYILMNKNKLYGLADAEGNIIDDFNYTNIVDYYDNIILYKEDGKYGIDHKAQNIYVDAKYEYAALYDTKYYVYSEDNKYYIAAYNTELPANNVSYDYVLPIGKYLLTISNKQVDILDSSLRTKLIMKIDTYLTYQTEQERDTLNIYKKDNYIYFRVVNDDKKYVKYMFDINTGKLYS